MHYGVCTNCGYEGLVEKHHVFFRSKARALKNCELNFTDLCTECHRGKNGVHTKDGHKLDMKLKKIKQNELIRLLESISILDDKLYILQLENVSTALRVPLNEVLKVTKNIKPVKCGYYKTIDVVRALQGGKLY